MTDETRQRWSSGGVGPRLAGVVAAVSILAIGTMAAATVMKYMDLETLVSESDVIVRGEVAEMEMVTDDRGTFRHTTIDVDQAYMGEPEGNVTVEQWRGEGPAADADRRIRRAIPGDATFEKGEEVVLFLREGHSRHDRQDVLYLSGLTQSKWTVNREGEAATVVRDLSELSVVDPDGGGELQRKGRQTRDLESFEATLNSVIYAEQGSPAKGGQ